MGLDSWGVGELEINTLELHSGAALRSYTQELRSGLDDQMQTGLNSRPGCAAFAENSKELMFRIRH